MTLISTAAAPAPGSIRRSASHSALIALMLTSVLSLAWLAISPTTAHAANVSVDQCNAQGPGPGGATTGMKCTVTVVNTLSGTTTSSTTTLTRECSLDPCAPGNGTFTTSSTDLVTGVNQCNGSDNDAAHPITCDVTITNNISSDTPGAQPVTAATVNQCVGSGAGGGGTVSCNPYPATTTGATVTQCNGSANGGGATIDCAVATASTVSPAIPISVNQCNGSGNPGGSVVTCRTTITTNVTAASTATPTATPTASASATPTSSASPQQVTRVPSGGVAAGDGSSSGHMDGGPLDGGLLVLGGGLLLAATTTALLRRRRAAGHATR